MRAQTALWRFYWLDVKPAIRARRRQPQEDVITQVLDRGFRDLDVLTECVTYGAAGMVTTRELITVGAWSRATSSTSTCAANADARAVGEEPLGLCPDRHVGTGVPASALSLGDGHHRCPGGPIGLMEAEVFLAALFSREIVADGPPRVRWNPVTLGYDLDGLMLRLAPPRSATVTTASRGAPVV